MEVLCKGHKLVKDTGSDDNGTGGNGGTDIMTVSEMLLVSIPNENETPKTWTGETDLIKKDHLRYRIREWSS